MREITETKAITQTVGYEALDGRRFSSKEECEKYERSAEYVLNSDFKAVLVGKTFPETSIWEDYGYGSDQFEMAIVDLRNTTCLEIVNHYLKYKGVKNLIKPELVGEKILIDLGSKYDDDIDPHPRTMDMLVKGFINNLQRFFGEEYTLDQVVKQTVAYKLKNAIEFYEKESYTAEDLYNTVKSVYEIIK